MEYMCKKRTGKATSQWSGEIRLLDVNGDTYEAEISGRDTYFHVIIESIAMETLSVSRIMMSVVSYPAMIIFSETANDYPGI